jgi:hypothetical protein
MIATKRQSVPKSTVAILEAIETGHGHMLTSGPSSVAIFRTCLSRCSFSCLIQSQIREGPNRERLNSKRGTKDYRGDNEGAKTGNI